MDNKEAIEKADKSLAVIEQFEAVIEDLDSFINSLPQMYLEEGKPVLERLKSLYELINIDVTNIDTLDLNSKKARSKIERRRLSHEVIRLIEEEGLYYKEVGERLGISGSTVSKFYKQYENAKLSERAAVRRSSIFDTYDQMESLSAKIYKALATYEGMDGNVHVKYIEQMRKLITEAHQWMDRVSEKQKLEEIGMIVREVLSNCTKDQEELIAKRFEEIGLGSKTDRIMGS